jgi:hypothetical protein
MISIARDTLLTRRSGETLRSTPIEATASDLQTLAELDLSALGVSREKHHRYLLNDAAMKGVFLHEGGDRIGYVYVSATGHVGPLAVTRTDRMTAGFETALDLAAATDAPQISAFLPGVSQALAVAVKHRMRIAFPMVLVSSQDFGDWTRYLPRNPGFM